MDGGKMRAQTTEHRAQTTEHRQQSTERRTQTTEHRQQSTDNRAQNTDDRIQTTDNRTQNTNKGFSLIEVMVALVVLLIGMLGVMAMQYYAISGNTASRELRIATTLTHELIEQIKSTPYNGLSSDSDNPLVNQDISISGGRDDYIRRWWVVEDCVNLTLTGDDNSCNANLIATCTLDPDPARVVPVSAIRARTCWTDKNGITHSITIDTLRWNEDVVL
jgi:prepilin-type N-terminal cleavage/methylation domain-containing protein